MKPFRTSLTARLIAASISETLLGGALALLTGHEIFFTLGIAIGIALGITALVYGVADYAQPVLLSAVLLPVGLFLYVMGMEFARQRFPELGWVLLVGSTIPLVMILAGPYTVRRLVVQPQSRAA